MIPTLVAVWALAQEPAPFPYAEAEARRSVEITVEELRAHVYRLASPEFLGRRGPGGERASQYLADLFQGVGLKPAFGDSYFQPIPWLLAPHREGAKPVGRNVAAMLPGSDPVLRDEWIVLSAHFDHLGMDRMKLYPGADDNAAAVAMLIEVAEHFALRKDRPRRTILFVSFDLEEQMLQGSAHFAAHPPLPFSRLKAFMTADLLGRSMGNIMDDTVYVLGSETAPELRALIEAHPPRDLIAGRLGADLVGTRSDYGAFRDRKVPFLFFTSGTHPDYHRPTDLPERIEYDKLCRVSQWIGVLTERLANADSAPVWKPDTTPDLDEVRTVLRLLERTLAMPERLKLTASQREEIQAIRNRLAAILERGKITAEERSSLVWTARRLLLTVYQ